MEVLKGRFTEVCGWGVRGMEAGGGMKPVGGGGVKESAGMAVFGQMPCGGERLLIGGRQAG